MFRICNLMTHASVPAYLGATVFIAPLVGNPFLGLALGTSYLLFTWFAMVVQRLSAGRPPSALCPSES